MGIGVDSSGNVYVSDDGDHRIQKFTSTGTFLTQWGSYGTEDGQFDGPQGIAADSSGNVYVADLGNCRIQKFTYDGTFLAKWGPPDVSMQFPRDLAVDSSDNVYVASTGFHNIVKTTSDGTFLTEWGSPGSGYGQFSDPVGIGVDGDGYVYVADTGNNRIQKFTSDGTFVAMWEIEGVIGLAVDSSSNVYVMANDVMQKFTSDGTFLTRWGRHGSGDGQFSNTWQIEVDSSGNVYVADAGNKRIQKFQPVSTSSQQLTRSNSKILNNNFSVDKNSTQKPSAIKPPNQNRSKQQKQIKKKDNGNEKSK
jgi:streptogramin lyase